MSTSRECYIGRNMSFGCSWNTHKWHKYWTKKKLTPKTARYLSESLIWDIRLLEKSFILGSKVTSQQPLGLSSSSIHPLRASMTMPKIKWCSVNAPSITSSDRTTPFSLILKTVNKVSKTTQALNCKNPMSTWSNKSFSLRNWTKSTRRNLM